MDRRTFLRSIVGLAGSVVALAGAAATSGVEAAPIARAAALPELPQPASSGGHTPDGTEVEQVRHWRRRRWVYGRRRRRRVYYVRRRRRYWW